MNIQSVHSIIKSMKKIANVFSSIPRMEKFIKDVCSIISTYTNGQEITVEVSFVF